MIPEACLTKRCSHSGRHSVSSHACRGSLQHGSRGECHACHNSFQRGSCAHGISFWHSPISCSSAACNCARCNAYSIDARCCRGCGRPHMMPCVLQCVCLVRPCSHPGCLGFALPDSMRQKGHDQRHGHNSCKINAKKRSALPNCNTCIPSPDVCSFGCAFVSRAHPQC